MNIVYALLGLVTAKTCGCTGRRQVTFAFSADPHNLCLDKRDVLEVQVNACERLLKYTKDAAKSTVEKEISELKMALDLMA